MKNVNDIIQEVKDRNIPESMETIQEYASAIYQVTGSVSGVVSILIATARHKNFLEVSKSEWIKWAMQEFKFTSKSHVHKCRHVGEMLLEVPDAAYQKMLPASFDKLYAMRDLDVDQVEHFINSNDLEKMSRQEVRDEVNKIMGKEAPIKEEQDKTTEKLKKFYAAASMVARMSVPELMDAVNKTDMAMVLTMLEAGKKLFAAGMEGIPQKQINNIDILNRIELYLNEQIKDIKAQKTRVSLTQQETSSHLLSDSQKTA